MKKEFPVKAIIIFSVLVAVGAIITATADSFVAGYHQVVLANMGSAIVGGSLAFFLVEMFRWDREHNKGK
ncbi:hypothetical protein ACFLUP_04505 [Chloroflexota bacterium]